jgi:hypothetical protein
MRNEVQKSIASRCQQGYAILTVMFFLTLVVLATILVAPNLVTDVQRQKEEEMIWRGKQYVRGIRLYYAKMHRFPTQLEDLYKPKTGIRFMRKAYTDPMNTADGSWRMIYVGPNGQLIGSTKNRSVTMSGQPTGGFGTAMGANGNSAFGASSSSGFGGMTTGNASQTPAPGAQNAQPTDNPQGTAGTDSSQPTGLTDTSSIIGGNIIGVGSKIDKKSIIWYDKAKNYRQFEFIWDPSVDALTGQRIGSIPVTNPNPFGPQPNSNSNAPTSPFSSTPGSTPVPVGGANPNPNPAPVDNPPLQAPPNQ